MNEAHGPHTESEADNRVHPILKAILRDGASLPRSLTGYMGPSNRDGHVTVYPNLTHLQHSYEIAVDDILYTADVPEFYRPFGAQVIWLRGDAFVAFRNVHIGGSSSHGDIDSGRTSTSTDESGSGTVSIQVGRLRMERSAERQADHCTCVECVVCMSHCDNSCASGACHPVASKA